MSSNNNDDEREPITTTNTDNNNTTDNNADNNTTNNNNDKEENNNDHEVVKKDKSKKQQSTIAEEENNENHNELSNELTNSSSNAEDIVSSENEEDQNNNHSDKLDQQEEEHSKQQHSDEHQEEHVEEQQIEEEEEPFILPDPNDLINLSHQEFLSKYVKISDQFIENFTSTTSFQLPLIQLLSKEIEILNFIKENYKELFDEYKFLNNNDKFINLYNLDNNNLVIKEKDIIKANNSYWFTNSHMIGMLNKATRLKNIDSEELIEKISELFYSCIDYYLNINLKYSFQVYKFYFIENNNEDNTENKKFKKQLNLQLIKSISLGSDVCRSLTYQKHDFYNKYLVKDQKLINNDLNSYNEIINKNQSSNWNENYENFIFSLPKPKMDYSKFCCKAINIFGQHGGYIIYNELLKSFKDLPIKIVDRIVECIFNQYPFLNIKFRDLFTMEFVNSFFKYISNLSDEIIKNEKPNFYENLIFLFRNKILSGKLNEDKTIEISDKLKLEFFYRLLQSPTVERKLYGMNEIKSFVEQLIKSSSNNNNLTNNIPALGNNNGGVSGNGALTTTTTNNSLNNNNNNLTIVKKELHIKVLLHWIEEKKLLNYLFEKDVHRELIRQSTLILQFLASNKGFSNEELDLLWGASNYDKHEATQRLIFGLITNLISSLSANNILYLFSKIDSIPIETISKQDHYIEFLAQFTIESVNAFVKLKDKRKTWFGLDLLWKLAIQNNRKAFECLCEVFKYDNFEPQRKTCLKSCIDMLKSRTNVTGAVTLMKTILDTYNLAIPQNQINNNLNNNNNKKKKVKLGAWSVIDSINDKTKFVDIFFSNFEQQFPTDQEYNEQSNQELKEQLDFLEFILKNSPITLTFKNCIVLWTHGYKPTVLEWFLKLRNNFTEDFEVFDENVTKLVFEELLCAKSKDLTNLYSDMSEIEFKCFYIFFLAVNINNNTISIIYEDFDGDSVLEQYENGNKKLISKIANTVVQKGRGFLEAPPPNSSLYEEELKPVKKVIKKFVTASENIIGIEHLWNIVLSAKDNAVIKNSIEVLNNFKSEFTKEMKYLSIEHRETHVKECMTKLKKYERNERYLVNIISLLLDYIYLFNSQSGGGGIFNAHGISCTGAPITLRIKCFNDRFVKVVPCTLTIANLRKLIATELGDESCAPLLRIETSDGFDLTSYPTKTLKECDIADDSSIYVKRITTRDVTFSLLNTTLKALGVPEIGNLLLLRNSGSSNRSVSDNGKKNKEESTSIFSSLSGGHDPIDSDYVILSDEKLSYPNIILSRDDNFSTLFSLLDIGDDVAKKAWLLLMHLPTNAQMAHNIQNIEKQTKNVDWEIILPTKSIHKLLYTLQIVDSKFSKNLTPNSPLFENFIKLGGVNHLLKGLLQNKKEYFSKTPLHKQCLGLLLKTINKFLSHCAKEHYDFENLLLYILDILPCVVFDEKKEEEATITSGVISVRESANNYQYNPSFLSNESDVNTSLMENGLNTIILLTSIHHKLLERFLQHDNLKLFIKQSLLESNDSNIRKQFSNAIYELSLSQESACEYFVPLLYRLMIEEDIDTHKGKCEQFFTLLESLMIHKGEKLHDVTVEEISNLVSKILSREIIEESDASSCDHVLIGLLNITRVLLRLYPNAKQEIGPKVYNELFHSCLFQVPTYEQFKQKILPPKCKTKQSREAAFNFLIELADCCSSNFDDLFSLVETYLGNCNPPTLWGVFPKALEKKQKFVGLRNQGATCYMNSLVQQFFMTIPFRKELLKINTLDKYPDESNMQDNVNLLRELQYMFAYLQDSYKKYYDTKPFCRTYKVEGQPVNCAQQHDANEFFNLFMDRIEEALKFYGKSNLLKQVFGGTLLHQIIYEDKVSQRPEQFNIISLEVKDKHNILESLDLYVKGDMLVGNNQYFSEDLNRHVDALKRTLIRDLPNVLILHLKRFDFDFETMVNRKVNDRIEFPHILNMEPYTVEGMERIEKRGIFDIPPKHREDDYYQYKLVGVLVHSGSAESGHYYSFIMDRSDPEKKWYEFNDKEVSPFDADQSLDKECFGGEIESYINNKKFISYRCNNAYMLLYQRIKLIDAEVFPQVEEEENDIIETATTASNEQEHTSVLVDKSDYSTPIDEEQIVDFDEEKSPTTVKYLNQLSFIEKKKQKVLQKIQDMPLDVKLKISNDNEKFYHDRYIFSESFDAFIFNFLSTIQPYDNNCLMKNIKFTTKYCIEFYSHSYNPKIVKWFMYLKSVFEKDIDTCKWFLLELSNNEKYRIDMLLQCPIPEIKDSFIDLILAAIKILYPHEDIMKHIETIEFRDKSLSYSNLLINSPAISTDSNNTNNNTNKTEISAIATFMDAVIQMIPICQHYYRSTTSYFRMISDFASLGPLSFRLLLLNRQIISKFALLLNGNTPKHTNNPQQFEPFYYTPKNYSLASSFGSTSLAYMIHVFNLLVRTCETVSSKDCKKRPIGAINFDLIDIMKNQSTGIIIISTQSMIDEELNKKKEEDSMTSTITTTSTAVPVTVDNTEEKASEEENNKTNTIELVKDKKKEFMMDLPNMDRDKLFNRGFFNSLISANICITELQDILIHWCWESLIISKNFCNLVIQALMDSVKSQSLIVSNEITLEPYASILDSLIKIEDSIQEERTNIVLSDYLDNIMKEIIEKKNACFVCLRHLGRIDNFNKFTKQWWDKAEGDITQITAKHKLKLQRLNSSSINTTTTEN
ncbi:hypothetical protein ABK040_011703 [Willaertia magna]